MAYKYNKMNGFWTRTSNAAVNCIFEMTVVMHIIDGAVSKLVIEESLGRYHSNF